MASVKRTLALLGAGALFAAGCTSGGDQQVVAAGDTARAVVTAALDAAVSGTGRVEFLYEVDEEAMWELLGGLGEGSPSDEGAEPLAQEGPDDLDQRLSGEFDGDDFLLSDDEGLVTRLRVDERTFESTRSAAKGQRDLFGGLPATEPGSGGVEELEAFQPPPFPDGVEWIEIDPDGGTFSGGFGFAHSTAGDGWHLVRSDQIGDVADAGTSEVGGVRTHRYTASLDREAVAAQLGNEPGGDTGEEQVDGFDDDPFGSFGAIEEYLVDHLSIDVEIHLDDEQRLVRVAMSPSLDLDPEFAGCTMLTMAAPPLTVTADYSDLGAEVDIEAPSDDAVISGEDYDELLGASMDDWLGSGALGDLPPLPHMPSERAFGPDGEPNQLATADGERYRADIEDDLVKFGSVIDLDPGTVADLDDAALVEAHDRASAAIAALPVTTTVMGELTRVEMVWNVKWGMETFGIDTSRVDTMGDQELATLIDAYVGENGLSGDGIWGDGPMSFGEMYSQEWPAGEEELGELGPDGPETDDELFGDVFEGCPGF